MNYSVRNIVQYKNGEHYTIMSILEKNNAAYMLLSNVMNYEDIIVIKKDSNDNIDQIPKDSYEYVEVYDDLIQLMKNECM